MHKHSPTNTWTPTHVPTHIWAWKHTYMHAHTHTHTDTVNKSTRLYFYISDIEKKWTQSLTTNEMIMNWRTQVERFFQSHVELISISSSFFSSSATESQAECQWPLHKTHQLQFIQHNSTHTQTDVHAHAYKHKGRVLVDWGVVGGEGDVWAEVLWFQTLQWKYPPFPPFWQPVQCPSN